MPNRFNQRKHIAFTALPRHKQRNAVARLGWKIQRSAIQTGITEFWTDELLEDPSEPERQHQWTDVYFLGRDRFTLWNAEIITTKLALDDAIRERAFTASWARLSTDEQTRQSSFETIAVPRKRAGGMRLREWVRQPDVHYPQFDMRTFNQECERLETDIRATEPPEIGESFTTDHQYAYGIGLHAVVAETNINHDAIVRTIQRFRDVGERDWHQVK